MRWPRRDRVGRVELETRGIGKIAVVRDGDVIPGVLCQRVRAGRWNVCVKVVVGGASAGRAEAADLLEAQHPGIGRGGVCFDAELPRSIRAVGGVTFAGDDLLRLRVDRGRSSPNFTSASMVKA